MPAKKDYVGHTFGMLYVVSVAPKINANKRYTCLCECGRSTIAYAHGLVSGHKKSCGCLKGAKPKHGMSDTSIYWIWNHMMHRCFDSKNPHYKNYGARGITVCQRWAASFSNFLQDMGERPDGLSLDRIDNSKGYEPSNCRWASRKQQNNNQRTNILIEDKDGEVLTLSQLAEKHNKKYGTLKSRFYRFGRDKQKLIDSI